MYNHYTIYKITNLINNKVYIGQTIRLLSLRQNEHISASKNDKSIAHNDPIHRTMRKYGIENFTIVPICSCFDIDELNEKETFFILEYKSNEKKFGYNCDTGGKNKVMSEDTKIKISKTKTGTKQSKEFVEKRISKIRGKKNSKVSLSLIGNTRGKNNKGSHRTEETKKKMRENSPNLGKIGSLSPRYGLKHPGIVLSGSKHYKYDHTEYVWVHDNGTEIIATSYDLVKKFDLASSAVRDMVRGVRYNHKGWSLKS